MPVQIKVYRELIDLVLKTPQNIRFDTLDSFAKRRGLSYDRVKKMMEVLAYASEGELKRVPKSIRSDVRNTKNEIIKGRISAKDAEEASRIFLSRTPLVDIERLNRQFLTHDPEVIGLQRRVAENAEKMMERMIRAGVHPVRAYSQTWSLVGRTLHNDIHKALGTVPKEHVNEVMTNIWRKNLIESQAHRQYENARLRYMNLLRGYITKPQALPIDLPAFMRRRGIEKNADKYWQRLDSDLKNVQRFPRPGAERPFPKEVKVVVKEMYYEHGLPFVKPEYVKIGVKRVKKVPDFEPELKRIGRHLKAADRMWAQARQFEKESISPFVRLSKKRTR